MKILLVSILALITLGCCGTPPALLPDDSECYFSLPPLTVLGSKTPVFLSLNQQVIQNDSQWAVFLSQLDRALTRNLNLVEVVISGGDIASKTSAMQTLKAKLGKRKIRLIIRYNLPDADSTLSDTWLSNSKDLTVATVHAAKSIFGCEVIGYHPAVLAGGEWFLFENVSAAFADRAVEAQMEIAKAIKNTAGRSIIVGFNAGYLYSLAFLNGSLHIPFQKVLDCSDIDLIISPYDYSYTRALGTPFLPMGPLESATLHNKIWIIEDDTRTSLAPMGSDYRFAQNATDDVFFISRNIAGAKQHGAGIYFLDLFGTGWFDSDYIWDAIAASNALPAGTPSTTLVLLDNIKLADLSTAPALLQIPGIVRDAGSNVVYGLQSDVNLGLLNPANFTTVINLY